MKDSNLFFIFYCNPLEKKALNYLTSEKNTVSTTSENLTSLYKNFFNSQSNCSGQIYRFIGKNYFIIKQSDRELSKNQASRILYILIKEIEKLQDQNSNNAQKQKNHLYFFCHDKHIGETDAYKLFSEDEVKVFLKNNDALREIIDQKYFLDIISFQHEPGKLVYDKILKRLNVLKPKGIISYIKNYKSKLYELRCELYRSYDFEKKVITIYDNDLKQKVTEFISCNGEFKTLIETYEEHEDDIIWLQNMLGKFLKHETLKDTKNINRLKEIYNNDINKLSDIEILRSSFDYVISQLPGNIYD